MIGGRNRDNLCPMKYIAAALLVLSASPGLAGSVTSHDLQRRCAGFDGAGGKAFCDGYLRGQLEALLQREGMGQARACVSKMDDAQISGLQNRIVSGWLIGDFAAADINTALSSGNLCP
jgi:hypothetical protein